MVSLKKIKVVSLILFASIGLIVFLAGDTGLPHAQAFSSGPLPGLTGAPGETTCLLCHSPSSSSSGEFVIEGPADYQAGETYQIKVRHTSTDTSRRRWGFELTVLTANNLRAGTLESTDQTTQVLNGTGSLEDRQYIEHTFAGSFLNQPGGAQWMFNWTAPSSNVGPVTFYAAGNQANADGVNSGDNIYTARLTVRQAGSAVAPRIVSVSAGKKHLFVMGEGFEAGALLFINGVETNTRNDEEQPTSILLGVKAVKKGKVPIGVPIMLKVKNPGAGGLESEDFSFLRE